MQVIYQNSAEKYKVYYQDEGNGYGIEVHFDDGRSRVNATYIGYDFVPEGIKEDVHQARTAEELFEVIQTFHKAIQEIKQKK